MFKYLLLQSWHSLSDPGLKVKATGEAIVDATLIPFHARPRKVTDLDEDGNSNTRYSSDPDARWKKKGSDSYFGYEAFS